MSAKKKIRVKIEENESQTERDHNEVEIAGGQPAEEPLSANSRETAETVKGRPEADEREVTEEVLLSPDEITKLLQEKEEQYDRLLRTQADFDNYRKRAQKEQANLLRYGVENALLEILPVVDNIERAVDSARAHEDSTSQLREGVELILSQFLDVLKKLGVTPIETVGHPFDPNKHDALLRVHAPDVSEGAVVEEIRKGYYLHDKVLRPAQVTVGTNESVHEGDGPPE